MDKRMFKEVLNLFIHFVVRDRHSNGMTKSSLSSSNRNPGNNDNNDKRMNERVIFKENEHFELFEIKINSTSIMRKIRIYI